MDQAPIKQYNSHNAVQQHPSLDPPCLANARIFKSIQFVTQVFFVKEKITQMSSPGILAFLKKTHPEDITQLFSVFMTSEVIFTWSDLLKLIRIEAVYYTVYCQVLK